MKIGLLLPSLLTSNKVTEKRIFAPLNPAIHLADTLVEYGHTVYFYTSPDVKTKAQVVAGDIELVNSELEYFQFRFREEQEKKFTLAEILKRDFENSLTLKAYSDALQGKVDIIHSYHDFMAHYFDELTHFPTLYTLHDPLPQSKNTVEYHRLSKFKHHNYISISKSQQKSIIDINFRATIYHGLPENQFEFNASPDNYFIFFGRMIQDKGPDLAIQAALKTKQKLLIATSDNTANTSNEYFMYKIKPYLSESIWIEGFLKDKTKLNAIKKARAFIFPLQWEEPFGLAVIESLACGTPVIAFNRGSMPELIQDGVTGYLVEPEEGLEGIVKAMNKIDLINRLECRKAFEAQFTSETMTEKYVEVYKNLLYK